MVMDTHAAISDDVPASQKLIELLVRSGVLTFGQFTLKSGRVSPYFMNFGKVSSGKAFDVLGGLYAARIGRALDEAPDVIFGPAYKGIPLAFQAASHLAHAGFDVGVAYNRKEAKAHGEGGEIIGANLDGKRVVIVDDVITAGTALGEAVEIIRKAGGIPVAAFVAFDRMEKGKESDLSAVQEAREKYGFPVYSIAGLDDLLTYLETFPEGPALEDPVGDIIEAVKTYRAQYGADYGVPS